MGIIFILLARLYAKIFTHKISLTSQPQLTVNNPSLQMRKLRSKEDEGTSQIIQSVVEPAPNPGHLRLPLGSPPLGPPATLATLTPRSRSQCPEMAGIWLQSHSRVGSDQGPEGSFLNSQSLRLRYPSLWWQGDDSVFSYMRLTERR